MSVHIRPMIRRDLPEVLDIEYDSFSDPWDEDEFRESALGRNTIHMAAETVDKVIVGFMVYELHRRRLYLEKLAVHHNYRRQGVGAEMINKLRSKLAFDPDRRHMIELELHEENLEGQLFFRKMGFLAVEVIRGGAGDADSYRMLYKQREYATNE